MHVRDFKTILFIGLYIAFCVAAALISLLAPWPRQVTVYVVGSLGLVALLNLGLGLWF